MSSSNSARKTVDLMFDTDLNGIAIFIYAVIVLVYFDDI